MSLHAKLHGNRKSRRLVVQRKNVIERPCVAKCFSGDIGALGEFQGRRFPPRVKKGGKKTGSTVGNRRERGFASGYGAHCCIGPLDSSRSVAEVALGKRDYSAIRKERRNDNFPKGERKHSLSGRHEATWNNLAEERKRSRRNGGPRIPAHSSSSHVPFLFLFLLLFFTTVVTQEPVLSGIRRKRRSGYSVSLLPLQKKALIVLPLNKGHHRDTRCSLIKKKEYYRTLLVVVSANYTVLFGQDRYPRVPNSRDHFGVPRFSSVKLRCTLRLFLSVLHTSVVARDYFGLIYDLNDYIYL